MVEAIRNSIEHTTIQVELVTKPPKADDKAKIGTEAEGQKSDRATQIFLNIWKKCSMSSRPEELKL